MNNNRIINLLIGGGIAVVLLLGWFLGVSPILEQVTAANLQTQNMQTANTASAARLARLKKQYENLGPLQQELAKLQESIPADADIPTFLAEINALCAANGVSLTSLTVNDALAYVAPGAVVAPAVPAPGAAPTATPTPTAGAAAGATPPATTAAPDPSTGLVAVPVKVSVSGPYAQVMAFAGALQTGSRLLFVRKLSVTSSATDANFVAAIEGNIYALPLPAGVTKESITPTPPPAPTLTPTPSPTSTAGAGTPGSTPTPTPTSATNG